jgi:hypothetical protein
MVQVENTESGIDNKIKELDQSKLKILKKYQWNMQDLRDATKPTNHGYRRGTGDTN